MTALVFLLMMAGSARAESRELRKTMTARSLGMGGAFTAVADDGGAVIYNPAGLVESDFMGVMAAGGAQADNPTEFRGLLEAGDDFAAGIEDSPEDILAGLPTDVSAVGQGLVSLSLGTSAVAGDLRSEISGFADEDALEADLNYSSNGSARVGLSADILRIPAEVGTAAYGLNLRYNRLADGSYRIYKEDGDTYRKWEETAGAGLAVDGGLLLQMTPLVHMGLMVENAWAQSFDLTGEREVYEYDDPEEEWERDETKSEADLRREFSPDRKGRIGVAARIPVIKTTVAADLENAPLLSETEADPVLFLGMENEMLFETISLRAGTYSFDSRVFTAGAGISLAGAEADIGAGYSPGGNFATVMVQLGLGF